MLIPPTSLCVLSERRIIRGGEGAGACGQKSCQKMVGCLSRCCRSVGMSFVVLTKVRMLGCVHRASSQLGAGSFLRGELPGSMCEKTLSAFVAV